ncbi:stressosome-associated protein Prli42 [Amphibacillus sp. Q70]|uniref:stressosome-associated protein Prli42 n=1 Tax=Amphibacillus sp. Q70 TaxID=3453416 RepID=UPI003F83A430
MAKRKKPNHHNQTNVAHKPSKRDRRMKMIVYLMIIAMLGSVITTGLAYIL